MENFDEDSFSLEDKLPLIDECFKEDTVEAIIENLKKVDDDWSKKTVKLMGRMSPISMKVTLQMVRLGKELSLEDCLKMEYRLVRRCCQDSDFYEGTYTLYILKFDIFRLLAAAGSIASLKLLLSCSQSFIPISIEIRISHLTNCQTVIKPQL